jgi:hypothetical protein
MSERMKPRKEILDDAANAVLNERNKKYGEPDEDFQRIAAIASAMGFRVEVDNAARPLTGSDVSRFMIALKLSRLAWAPDHRDSWTDIAGYAACGFETATLERDRRAPAPVDLDPEDSAFGPVASAQVAKVLCGEVCYQGHIYRGACRFRKSPTFAEEVAQANRERNAG